MKPRLSVVVPVHNVEDYLEECLRSIAGQSASDIEVVLVDDGSTDGSTAIAERFAERDRRFRYVHQPNAGLSAARNTGVAHTTPGVPYLAFADSDDIVVHDAYARMLGSLETTGSDLATGNVWRLTEQGRQPAWQYRWLTTTRERTHISRDPRLLADRVAWNKVFRRSFWDRHAFTFPVGKLYEDTPVMIPAHYLAGSVDVLAEHVYYWRVREGSITRRRTDVKGVRDRIAACEQVSAFLGGRGSEANASARRRYDLSCLRDDFVYFLEGLPMGGPEYREAFMTDAGAFLDRMARLERPARAGRAPDLPVELRLKWRLVRERRLPELLDLLAFERDNGAGTFGVDGVPGRRRAVFPGVRGTTRLARADLPAVARLVEARWGRDGKLRLRGYAYIRNLPAAAPRHSLKLGMVRSARGQQVRTVQVRSVPAPEATVDSGQRLHDYDCSGFEMILDPGRLRSGSWLVGVMVAGHGAARRVAVRAAESAAVQPLVQDLGDGRRAVLDYRDGRLQLTLSRLAARCEAHVFGDELELSGRLFGGVRPTALEMTCEEVPDVEFGHPVVCGPGSRFTARVPLTDLAAMAAVPAARHPLPREVEAEPGGRWRARLVLPDGSRVALAATAESAPPVVADASGELVVDLAGQPVVDRAEWTADGALRVEGVSGAGALVPGALASHDDAPSRLVLRHEALRETVSLPVTYAEPRGAVRTGRARPANGARRPADDGPRAEDLAGRRFTAFLAPTVAAQLHEGRWDVFLDGRPVRVLTALTARLPRRHLGTPAQGGGRGREFAVDRRHGDRLTVHAGPALSVTERGAYRSEVLSRTRYPAARRTLPLRETILYTGGDSPRAVHAELVRRGVETEHLWVTDGRPGRVPATASAVVEHSTDWYDALARARRIVTSDQLPEWFERRPGQTVVQTWHGSPLGRFGTDLNDTLYADHHHLASLPERAAQWSFLVSPSRHATPVLRRALAYGGEILETGSPANDALFSPDREKTAERVRRRLGIPSGRRVVLYAPTYRDHLVHTPGGRRRYRWDPALDAAALAESIGDGHTLLVRRHPLVTGSVPEGPGVRDVSAHPVTAELLLIADVLVTDYAGLMFDFAHTGRPMLFHTYDLAHYRDTVRGFCLDFETRAPGPLLAGTDEIARLLRTPSALSAATARHAEAYESFRRDFCDLDDGGAAGRVVDRLLEA